MKIVLYYYSATGNTKKACEHLQRRIPGLELIDMAQGQKKPPLDFDVVGCAFPVYYLGLPPIVQNFLESLSLVKGTPAFLLTTYGIMGGKALRHASGELRKKGYVIMDYFGLRMSESFPPFIAKGFACTDAPTPAEVSSFNIFCDSISEGVRRLVRGETISAKKIKTGFFDMVIPVPSHQKIMRQFGVLSVNVEHCTGCYACRDACPYDAISACDKPIFDMTRCRACYVCFNTCPKGAITVSSGVSLPQYKISAGTKIEEKFV